MNENNTISLPVQCFTRLFYLVKYFDKAHEIIINATSTKQSLSNSFLNSEIDDSLIGYEASLFHKIAEAHRFYADFLPIFQPNKNSFEKKQKKLKPIKPLDFSFYNHLEPSFPPLEYLELIQPEEHFLNATISLSTKEMESLRKLCAMKDSRISAIRFFGAMENNTIIVRYAPKNKIEKMREDMIKKRV